MMSATLNIDLHCHSTISDGVLEPAAVAQRAKQNGVDVWALTDHDEIGGIPQAREAALDLGMHYITGVEISVTWASRTVHIVGLNFDETNDHLKSGLSRTRKGREDRAQQIARELEKVGFKNAFEGALKYVGNPDLISRAHFARYLVEQGAESDVGEVFKKYLSEGKPGFVPHQWAKLSDAIRWIREAGGIAVIAHPGRYAYSDVEAGILFNEFKNLGGQGMEVITGSHSPDEYDYYAKVVQRYGFLASRGSDFHDPSETHTDLGKLPFLPSSLKPVWQDWAILGR